MENIIYFSKEFRIIDEFTHDIRAWDFDARKLDCGSFYGKLSAINFNEVQLTSYQLSSLLDQQGTLIKDYTCFSIPANAFQHFNWYNMDVDSSYLLKFPFSRELKAISKASFHTYTIRIANEYLQVLLDRYALKNAEQWLAKPGENCLKIGTYHNMHLAKTIASFFHTLSKQPNYRYTEAFKYNVKLALPFTLLEIIDKHENHKASFSKTKKDDLLNNCLTYINTNIYENIAIKDITANTNVSSKTLENLFNERFGISPYKYIKRTKLNLLKQKLSTPHNKASVHELARQYQINHMGQLSSDYFKLFNEYPSQTKARYKD